jgi:hypothetical protein
MTKLTPVEPDPMPIRIFENRGIRYLDVSSDHDFFLFEEV